jgi:hypothetical protein
MTRVRTLFGSAALACLLAAPAQAIPIVGQTLIATGGDVVVTFVSNEAGFNSELYLDGPIGGGFGSIFNNWTTGIGTSLNLGTFADGSELIFRLFVPATGDAFYTGDATRNPDGIAHAAVDAQSGQVLVGFEDLFGGGDLDYDDLVFSFSNVSIADNGGPAPGSGGTGSAGGGSGGVPGSSVPHPGGGGPGIGAGPVDPGVGNGAGPTTPGGTSGNVISVDEPANLTLLGSGLVALVFLMKRQAVRR